jgi:cyclophilin family peptidyl-prolyl cis-trans isomerase
VLGGRGDFDGALEVVDRLGKDFPMLAHRSAHHLARVELMLSAARYDDAKAVLDAAAERLTGDPTAAIVLRLVARLRECWKLEADLRGREAERNDLPRVKLATSKGTIVFELFEDDAPNAVANFVSLVESGFYDGTRFHWVSGGGRVVGGDPNSRNDDEHDDGYGGPGYMIENEPGRRLMFPFTVAFVDRRDRRRSEGSSFLINVAPLPQLDGYSTVFGRVLEGQEVVRKLEYYDTLEKAEILRKRDHPYVPVKRGG